MRTGPHPKGLGEARPGALSQAPRGQIPRGGQGSDRASILLRVPGLAAANGTEGRTARTVRKPPRSGNLSPLPWAALPWSTPRVNPPMQPTAATNYDRAITVFSPDGRLFQVEYAREAVKRGTTAVGVRAKHGVALLVDKRISSKLVVASSIEKIFAIDLHVGCATSGLVADARALVDRARVEAQMNRVSYDEPIPVDTLAKRICDYKQSYTQYGGGRPFGTALLVAGVDASGPRLFETDPSGALIEYKASAVGSGRTPALEVLEAGFKEGLTLDAAIHLGIKALHAATDNKLNADALEIAVVEPTQPGGLGGFRRLPDEAVKAALKGKVE